MSWLEALLLGVIQGVTEFLPISSDGHLTLFQILAARLQGREVSGAENVFFDVMLHLGTLAAIAVYYRAVAREGVRGLLGSADVPPVYERPALFRLAVNVGFATLPLVPYALFLKKWLDQAFTSLTVTGAGFLVTAAALLVTTRLPGGERGPSTTRWYHALLIGLAQAVAPLPGVSRSGLTVAMALALGLSRTWAVQFSLLIAVPAILGAATFELRKVDPALLTGDRVGMTVAATVLAGLVGYAAIAWLVRIVRSGRMWYFSVYLIALGSLVLATEWARGGRGDGRQSPALDGAVRARPGGPGAGDRAGRGLRPVDRADPSGPRAGAAGPGAARRVERAAARLDLG